MLLNKTSHDSTWWLLKYFEFWRWSRNKESHRGEVVDMGCTSGVHERHRMYFGEDSECLTLCALYAFLHIPEIATRTYFIRVLYRAIISESIHPWCFPSFYPSHLLSQPQFWPNSLTILCQRKSSSPMLHYNVRLDPHYQRWRKRSYLVFAFSGWRLSAAEMVEMLL